MLSIRTKSHLIEIRLIEIMSELTTEPWALPIEKYRALVTEQQELWTIQDQRRKYAPPIK